MLNQFGPFRSIDITPEEFEKETARCLQENGMKITNCVVRHNEKIRVFDGNYQIDVTARLELFGGAELLVLVECKHQKNSIKREIVQALHDKIRSIGAHKGIIFSSSNFQKGALEYAKAHGIALVKVADGKCTYETRSLHGVEDIPSWLSIPKYALYIMEPSGNNGILVSLCSNSTKLLEKMKLESRA
ncbi:restriction endonuclease [Pelosinus sp. UFO1]|uniref:restriction endonuclease n=1 Tax=Pelosinus sp. UFO1 TaxID=484770 RepID=UPI0004D1247C|nr:restriction endonuclease [Pelosinus sp. UFO1]AIF52880.1 restriction endonuclease [Pelosinus sp. UFO1]